MTNLQTSAVTYLECKTPPQKKFRLTLQMVNELLGSALTLGDIEGLFTRLDFQFDAVDGTAFMVCPDPNRLDLYGANDICEEIARLYGYDNLPATPPVIEAQEKFRSLATRLETTLGRYLIGRGLFNVKTYSLLARESAEQWNLFGIENAPWHLQDPLSNLRDTYRLSLAPSLLEVAATNSAVGNKHLGLWEIGDVYAQDGVRARHLAMLVAGQMLEGATAKTGTPWTYHHAKGVLEAVLRLYNLDLTKISWTTMDDPIPDVHPYVHAQVRYGEVLLGFLFRTHARYESDHKFGPVFYMEMDLDRLQELAAKRVKISELYKYQASTRDLSLVISEAVQYQDIIKTLRTNVKYVVSHGLVDQYVDDKMRQAHQKSLTISFAFNSKDHQLRDEEIEKQWNRIIDNVRTLKGEVR